MNEGEVSLQIEGNGGSQTFLKEVLMTYALCHLAPLETQSFKERVTWAPA